MNNQWLVDLSQPSIQIPKLDLDKGKHKIYGVKIDDKKSSTILDLSRKLSQIDIELGTCPIFVSFFSSVGEPTSEGEISF